ncbi:hypothetical protein F4778DRAFT_724245 [Xylariomycetidae sp. FL2044]|nr:hypothetical protein F4778DRAFT_724245 [Xylariomycetidae sp. FL2044]
MIRWRMAANLWLLHLQLVAFYLVCSNLPRQILWLFPSRPKCISSYCRVRPQCCTTWDPQVCWYAGMIPADSEDTTARLLNPTHHHSPTKPQYSVSPHLTIMDGCHASRPAALHPPPVAWSYRLMQALTEIRALIINSLVA